MHTLWDCTATQDVWPDCSVKLQKSSQFFLDFLSTMEYLLERCDPEEVQLAVLVARQIWHRRNAVIFGGKFTSPKAIIQTAEDQLETFNSVESHRATTNPLSRRTDTSCWKPPPMGVLKSNWDAVVDGRGKRISFGVIVRDHDGGAMAMLSETMDFIQDPTTAKALAARRAAELSLSLGIRKLILEGDSLQIV